MLAAWFGPLWAERQRRDSQGRIFLNCDPYCFEKMLSFLRCKLIEHPDRPAPQPIIQQESQAEFAALIEYLGMREFMGTSNFHFSKTLNMVLSEEGSTAEAPVHDSLSFAAPAMQYGTVHFIKCTIVSFASGAWMFLGVTQLLEPRKDAETEATSFGWSETFQYSKSRETPSVHLPGWQQGDVLVLKVDLAREAGMLTLWSPRSSGLFEISLCNDMRAPFFLHYVAFKGGKLKLSPASMQDRQHFAGGYTHVQ